MPHNSCILNEPLHLVQEKMHLFYASDLEDVILNPVCKQQVSIEIRKERNLPSKITAFLLKIFHRLSQWSCMQRMQNQVRQALLQYHPQMASESFDYMHPMDTKTQHMITYTHAYMHACTCFFSLMLDLPTWAMAQWITSTHARPGL
jgi:hypothetical protein